MAEVSILDGDHCNPIPFIVHQLSFEKIKPYVVHLR